jgi:hypothetical protein
MASDLTLVAQNEYDTRMEQLQRLFSQEPR